MKRVATIMSIIILLAFIRARAGEENGSKKIPHLTNAQIEKRKQKMEAANVNLSLYGKVLNQYHKPVAHATVTVGVQGYYLHSGWKRKVFTRTTDGKGLFSVKNKRGRHISVSKITKRGYAFPPSKQPLNNYSANKPDKLNPVIFRLRKRGKTTFILRELYQKMIVDPTGKPAVGNISKDSGYYTQSGEYRNDSSDRFPGFTVSAAIDGKTQDWVLTFNGKHKKDEVLLLDHIVYKAPKNNYKPSASLRLSRDSQSDDSYQKSIPPSYEFIRCLIIHSAKPDTYARVKLTIYARGKKKCHITYNFLINPYGGRTFDFNRHIADYPEIWQKLHRQAIHMLCNGKTPPEPDIKGLLWLAEQKKTQTKRK